MAEPLEVKEIAEVAEVAEVVDEVVKVGGFSLIQLESEDNPTVRRSLAPPDRP